MVTRQARTLGLGWKEYDMQLTSRSVLASLFLSAAALALPLGPGCSSGDVVVETGAGGSGGGSSSTAPNGATTVSTGTGSTLTSLAVGTWNVHNLIDETINSSVPFEDVDPSYKTHRANVAKVIDSFNPEIFILQEVESQGVLDALNANLAKPYAHTKLIDGNDPRGIDVAMLSRVPPDKVLSHRTEKFLKAGTSSPTYSYARDCLEMHFTINGRHVVMLGVHFKSKDSDDPDKRLAEAQHTRVIANGILKADPNALLLVLGDFNDGPNTPPLDALQDGSPPLLDVADAVPTNDRWTYKYGGKVFLIDHQLANPLLHDRLDPSSVKIPHTKSVTTASDHALLVATYDLQ